MYMFVYVTAGSEDEAEKIAKNVLEKKLAACVNMFKINSMYFWEGELEKSPEIGMIIKTRSDKFKELREEIKRIHSYSVPCICAIGIEDGLKEYFEWIDDSVSEK